MLASKKRTYKKNKKKNSPVISTPALGDFQRLFGRSSSGSPEFKMAEPRFSLSQSPDLVAGPDPSEGSRSPILYPNSSVPAESEAPGTPHRPFMLGADAELKAILQALPTRADIEALVGRVEAARKKEIRAVKQEVQALNTHLTAGESSLTTLEKIVTVMESRQDNQSTSAVELQLRVEEMEVRSRRNNVRLRGLPEATGSEDLLATVTDIFRRVAGDHLSEQIEVDRVH